MKINIKNQNFTLHPSGCLFWDERKILLISDVHIGKVAHFRKHGMAIPNRAVFENFEKLTAVLELFNPEVIIFLGEIRRFI